MPKNAQVTVKYGPYESSGTVQHRTFRLQGLLAALNARGHRCVLEESHERDQVDLLVNGQVVYTCDIRTLEFGTWVWVWVVVLITRLTVVAKLFRAGVLNSFSFRGHIQPNMISSGPLWHKIRTL
uniref:Uncharacterized protein n=1 Tax=Sphaeramia orbicularis TaxID=375764 RepID=A0A673CQ17_9TELE